MVGGVGSFGAAKEAEFAGQSVLNVLWHLHTLGFDPLLITRVGSDTAGRRIVRQLEDTGIDTVGVQVDDSLPTRGSKTPEESGEPCCAWAALDSRQAAVVLHETAPALLFHGIASTYNECIQNALNTITSRIAVPYFVDIDLTRRTALARTVRRALLGVKWIKVDAGHLRELLGDFEATEFQSTVNEALTVQARFAFDAIIVERLGMPILGIWPDKVIRGLVSPPDDPTCLPGGRDAATAVLIVGLLCGWQEQVIIERAAQFAFLAGTERRARDIDRMVYSSVLDRWFASHSNAAGS
ncbi:MAG: hypothetical protein P8127_05180 [Acidobacteriota bacterium]